MARRAFLLNVAEDEVHPFRSQKRKRMHLIPFSSLLFPIILVKAYVMILSIFLKEMEKENNVKRWTKERKLFPHTLKVAWIDFRKLHTQKDMILQGAVLGLFCVRLHDRHSGFLVWG